MNIKELLKKLIEKQDLSIAESEFIAEEILDGNVSDVLISSLLTALAIKGESVDELFGFITTMRNHMITIHAKNAIDVCGTGGDGKQTFNISTAVAFVVAGAGVHVAKHGNRSASSRCGSADVLEKLGVNITIPIEQAEYILQKAGIVFLFAPVFHPAMKYVAPVRKALGLRTIFNYLGPFCNPASVTKQLIGVPTISLAEKLACVAQQLDYDHALIVVSEDGFDEVSIAKKTHVYEIQKENISHFILDPKEYGFDYRSDEQLQGGDVSTNTEIITAILEGEKGMRRDVVVLNSAVALYVAGKVENIAGGIRLAEQAIDEGSARRVLSSLVKMSANN